MADLRIVDAPEIPTENITGEEKLPTGGSGNYSITLDSVADYTKTKKDLADNTSVDGKVNGVRQELDAHIEDLLNPHQVTKGQIGLGNVDNTADADKPVSNSTQAAIISAVAPKADKNYVDNQLALKANKVDVYTKQESNDLVNSSISTVLTPVNTYLDLAKRGIANRYDPLLTYDSGERVVLTNGDIVKSTVDGNANDPNVDVTGWVNFEAEQQEINDLNKDSSYLFKPSSALDHTAELQAAIDYCAANFLNCKPVGLFKTSGKIVIKGEFDGSRCRIQTTTAIPIAVEVSTGIGENPTTVLSLTESERIILPDVVNGTKPAVGWDGQGIGVRYVNVQNTLITERLVEGFAVGIQHTAYSAGCGYNTVDAGYLRNNKVNRQFKVGNDTGWTNRWDLFGGRYFHSSSEGVEVEGVMHFDVFPNATGLIINDINHWGGSLEGFTQQYHMRLGGAYINFWGIRLETPDSAGGVKVHLAAAGLVNQGAYNGLNSGRGVNGRTVKVTADPLVGTPAFSLRSNQGSEILIGNNTLTSYQTKTSSVQPALAVIDANAPFDIDRNTEWSLGIAAHKIMGKRRADAVSRIEFDTQNGRLYLGDGVTAPTKYLHSRLDGIGSASHFYPNSNDTYDNGNGTLKWRGVYSTKYMFTATVGAFYGSGTPEGNVVAGIGSTYHRTDGIAGQCFYVKESGIGNTGWIAK